MNQVDTETKSIFYRLASDLHDVREGKASKTDAIMVLGLNFLVYLAVPAMLFSAELVGLAQPRRVVWLVVGGTGLGTMVVVYALLFLTYYCFGYAPLRWLATPLIGARIGFWIAGLLIIAYLWGYFFLGFPPLGEWSAWIFLLCPILALIWPWLVHRSAVQQARLAEEHRVENESSKESIEIDSPSKPAAMIKTSD
jgi:hypothetical protein